MEAALAFADACPVTFVEVAIASNLSSFGGAPSGQTVLQLGVNSPGQSAKGAP